MDTKQARIVIIGGGFGGLFTALGLEGAGEVTLISLEDHFLFTPLLYEYLSGEVEAWHIAPYYKELLDDKIRFIRGEVSEIDLQAHEVAVVGRTRRIAYDVLVLAVGGVTNFWNIEGAEEYALPFRKVAHADALRQRMIDALDRVPPDAPPQDARRATTFAVVGGGASGVELATKMSDLLRDAFQRRGLQGQARVMVVEMSNQVVPEMDDEIRTFVEKALRDADVDVHTRTRVQRVTPTGLVMEHNGALEELEAAAVVWTAGVKVNPLTEKLAVPKDRRGLLIVEPTMQLGNREEVFALGDIAFYADVPPSLAGTSQLAYQQANLLARNIRALMAGNELERGQFVELGEAVSLGTESAAIVAGRRSFDGALARQARFALYTSRLPTWQHRLRVGASWFLGGTTLRPLVSL